MNKFQFYSISWIIGHKSALIMAFVLYKDTQFCHAAPFYFENNSKSCVYIYHLFWEGIFLLIFRGVLRWILPVVFYTFGLYSVQHTTFHLAVWSVSCSQSHHAAAWINRSTQVWYWYSHSFKNHVYFYATLTTLSGLQLEDNPVNGYWCPWSSGDIT